MNGPGAYLLLLAGCLVVTAPLEWVLGARGWRSPRRLAGAVLPVAVVFAAWDLWGIIRGSWWYDARYISGVHVGPMPVEELLFFLVIPVCGVLTYEAVGRCLQWASRASRGGPDGPGGGNA
ncbi:MAG: lycopene cyclase domain-containing protein [Austwickia sp.]|mgnify:CR=1 FL=1|nr:lycopene cyclase domain-containing protein [Austwickia sp.]MBK8437817.1 lycopene cyclase domain-containing protein [Austwickia sp.]MBK9100124.1 lycopene cyclase domain-containing protein [Austwickia sp.]